MALGYEIGTIMKRNSIIHSDDRLTVKLDTIEGMGHGFVQVRPPACWGWRGGGGWGRRWDWAVSERGWGGRERHQGSVVVE